MPLDRTPLFSGHLFPVCRHLEFHAQYLRCAPAHHHPLHENLKIVHDRSVFCVHKQLQLNKGVFLIDLQLGLLHGVIHPVMDVETAHVLIPDPAAAHI